MATICKIQRKNGPVFKAIIKDRLGRPIVSKTFTRKTDALTWSKRIEADEEEMEAFGSKGLKMTFAELIDEFMLQWTGRDKNQVNRAAFWKTELGTYKLREINADLLRKKLKSFQEGKCIRGDGGKGRSTTLDKPRSPGTVNRHRTTLSGIFAYAVKQGYLVRNPVARTSCLKNDNKIIRYLSDRERTALLAACKQSEWQHLYLLVLLAMTTGMRKAELSGLRWDDIDLNRSLAYLHLTKNGEPRVCPIPAATLTELKKIKGLGGETLFRGGLLFPGSKKPDQPMEFKKHWFAALEQANIKIFRFHDLRHDFCSQLAMQGAALHEIAELAGHKDLGTTKRYTHLSVTHKQALVERIMAKVISQ
jgi:integrase